MSYIGTVIIEFEVDADGASEAFTMMEERCSVVHELLLQGRVQDWIDANVGPQVYEYD